MYPPPLFVVDDPAELEALLLAARLGTLVTHGAAGLTATALPFVYDPAAHILSGHMALTNPQRLDGEASALVLFQRVEAYVSPSFYPSKAEHGRVVPTWNYESLQVHGRARWTDDRDWLSSNVRALTDRYEADRPDPWRVDDAPAAYIDQMLSQIIGVEIVVERIAGRRKLSQNRPSKDREGVANGLAASDRLSDQEIATVMRSLS